MRHRNGISRRSFLGAAACAPAAAAQSNRKVWVVPNFHPASCGWLTNFSKERVYCANSYFDHLDRVRDDPEYAFVLSECNNMIAMMNFKPERMPELKQRIKDGKVELVNGFFLESTVNLSGGEALVRLGIEGIRWQQQVFGVRPRVGWTIDVCGTHDQMGQICAGLGFDAMVYSRKNPTGSALHWAESPDGTKVLAVSSGHYSELRPLFAAKQRLTQTELQEIRKQIDGKAKITPEGAPILILAGAGDYALPPVVKEYPREFLREWREFEPSTGIRFGTMSQFLDQVLPAVKSGQTRIPTMRGGTAYDFLSFWIECPRVKTWYRRNEHALQAAEALSTIASLTSGFRYPVQPLYHAWLQMFLNMDRNTLWGAAGGMVFEHERSWDARDRFEWVEKTAREQQQAAARSITKPGAQLAIFNPVNWNRSDPIALKLPQGASIEGMPAQVMADGAVLCRPALSGFAFTPAKASPAAPRNSEPIALPETIETKFYRARIDAKTGALASLKLKASGREVLGAPANVIILEKPVERSGDPGDHMLPRERRNILATSNESPVEISAASGPLATVVTVRGGLPGAGPCRRTVVFHHDYPRIDFETELNDIPDRTVVTTEFPSNESIAEVRRGIPYGFSHGAWEKANPNLHGWTKSITPAVRWSHYQTAGGGFALFDRGLSGRELVERKPILFLFNATDKYYGYPNSWLTGKGRNVLSYALVAHDGEWRGARIPQMAFEYNSQPIVVAGVSAVPAKPYLETSDNVIVECLRRDGNAIEVRLAECLGYAGTAEVSLRLPHKQALMTDLVGGNAQPLAGGPRYKFAVRPQQIVTLRFRTAAALEVPKPLTAWDELVPEQKRAMLHEYSNDKGHPPRGD